MILSQATFLVQFSSVVQSCPTLCDRTDCFPVRYQLPKLAQTHVHQVSDATQLSHSLLSPSPPTFSLSQHRSTSRKWWPKQEWMMSQSAGAGRCMSVARKTMSAPWRMSTLCICCRWGTTTSRWPSHWQENKGHRQGITCVAGGPTSWWCRWWGRAWWQRR